jgi:hypothetical protein
MVLLCFFYLLLFNSFDELQYQNTDAKFELTIVHEQCDV